MHHVSIVRPNQRNRQLVNLLIMVCIAALPLLPPTVATAQDQDEVQVDTVTIESTDATVPDTVLIQSYAKRYDPRKAILFAAVPPGLGQVYNRKYWKLPLVYGGFYAIGYGLNWYNGLHKEYRGYLFQNLETGIGENEVNPALPQKMRNVTTSQLRNLVDKARRERDFMIILMGGMYILQMIDAHVDAHLKEFDLNPRLQVRLEPAIDADQLTGRTVGVALVVKF